MAKNRAALRAFMMPPAPGRQARRTSRQQYQKLRQNPELVPTSGTGNHPLAHDV
jgi:hypothetical protein